MTLAAHKTRDAEVDLAGMERTLRDVCADCGATLTGFRREGHDLQLTIDCTPTVPLTKRLGARYGVSHTTVATALRRQGIQLRPRPGWRYASLLHGA